MRWETVSVLQVDEDEPAVIPGATEGCAARRALTAAQQRLLVSLPAGTQHVDATLHCELEAEHAGAHYALGQISGGDWWWLRWPSPPEQPDDPATAVLVEMAPCDALAEPGGPGEQGVPCALPIGHVGAHGFTRPA